MKKIIEDYKYGIKAIIHNLTGSHNEDLEQEVYIKAWRNRDKYQEQNNFGAWIYKIAQNTCKDFLKSATFKKANITDSCDDTILQIKDNKQNPENEFLKKQRQKLIINSIEKLSPKMKEVIILYDMYGLSYEKIAQKLNCPEGTVKSRIYNARKELAISLKDLI